MSRSDFETGRLAGLREAISLADKLGSLADRATKADDKAQARMATRIARALDARCEGIEAKAALARGDLKLSGASRQPEGSVGG